MTGPPGPRLFRWTEAMHERMKMATTIYIAKEVGTQWLKAGVTTSVRKRLQDLQTGNPRRLKIVETITAEDLGLPDRYVYQWEAKVQKELHFLTKNRKAEWFLVPDGQCALALAREAKENLINYLKAVTDDFRAAHEYLSC